MLKPCIEEEKLVAFVQNKLTIAHAEEVERHLDACTSCRSLLVGIIDHSLVDRPEFDAIDSPESPPFIAESDPHQEDLETPEKTGSANPKQPPLPALLPTGTRRGRYILLEPIGWGGMGVVYAAFDPELNRKVALKLLRLEFTEGTLANELKSRLLREAQAMARFSHPHVVRIYDVGSVDDRIFIAMEFIEGLNLRQWLNHNTSTTHQILSFFVQAGEGLAAAHEEDLVHRDFKPDNILIGKNGSVSITDFGLVQSNVIQEAGGISSLMDRESQAIQKDKPQFLTRAGSLIGTLPYMAPEQLRSQTVDARSDQFSFCVALYESLCGERPFPGKDTQTLLAQIKTGPKTPETSKEIAPWLWSMLQRGLAPHPDDRYPSMNALLEELHHAVTPPATLKSQPLLVAGLGMLMGLFVLVLLYAIQPQKPNCQDGTTKLSNVWNEEKQQSMQKAFLKIQRQYAPVVWRDTKAVLDRYSRQWVETYTKTCQATHVLGEQSERLLDLRMMCLTRRLQDFKALVDVLGNANERVLLRASGATLGLDSLQECRRTQKTIDTSPPPSSPKDRDLLKQVEGKLSRVNALRLSGLFRQSEQLAKTLDEPVQRLQYLPLTARVSYVVGKTWMEMGRWKAAVASMRKASVAAIQSEDDRTTALSWIGLMQSHIFQSQFREANEYKYLIKPLLSRIKNSQKLRLSYQILLGYWYDQKGSYKKAISTYQHAIQLLDQTIAQKSNKSYELDGLNVIASKLYNNAGTAASKSGKYKYAHQLFKKSLLFKKKYMAPSHPSVGLTLGNLGQLLREMGQWKQAMVYFKRSYQIKEKGLRSNHPWLAADLSGIASIQHQQKKYKQALQTYKKVFTILEKNFPSTHVFVGLIHNNVGNVYLDMKLWGLAVNHYNKALKVFQKGQGLKHQNVGMVWERLGALYAQRKMFNKAWHYYQKAEANLKQSVGPKHPTYQRLQRRIQALQKRKAK